MIVFWIAAALLSAAAAALIVHFAGREPLAVGADPSAVVYRRQLDEIDDLANRGLLADDERESAHAEAARRLLSAGEVTAEAPTTKATRLAVLAAAIVTALAAAVVYAVVGQPGRPDQPFAARSAVWIDTVERAARGEKVDTSSIDAEKLTVVLKKLVADDPGDPARLATLAQYQIKSGQLQLAIHNLKKVTRMDPGQAEVWALLGELLMAATPDQTVTPEAVVAFTKARDLDPKAVGPRFFLGRARIANGDIPGGLADWRALAAEMPAGEPAAALQAEIARVEKAGSLEVAAPQQAPTDDMIQGMVQGLADRLKANPDDPEGWARLVRSYGVLGDATKQQAALKEARRIFKDRPADLAAIEAATKGPPR